MVGRIVSVRRSVAYVSLGLHHPTVRRPGGGRDARGTGHGPLRLGGEVGTRAPPAPRQTLAGGLPRCGALSSLSAERKLRSLSNSRSV